MKYIPYGRQTISKKDIDAVVRVLKSDFITQGPKVSEFEAVLCSYTGAAYAVAVSSGTAALHIACLAAGIKSGDEVITSPITFVASANCVLYCGARPIFADIQEDTFNIDPQAINNKLNKRTKAIIPVHFSGHPADLVEIKNISKKHNLFVIEDAAHALGAVYRGSKIGSCKYSDMTIFSFHPVKHITTGEGGAVLTNKKELYDRLLMLRNHGITRDKKKMQNSNGLWYYEMQMLGFNYRITDFQCSLGISQLKRIEKLLKRRREIAKVYNRELSGNATFELPVERNDVRSAWHLYVLRLKSGSKSKLYNKRNRIFNYLRDNNIGVQLHYIPVHLQPYYRKNFGYKENDYPKAEDYYHRALTIPLWPKMNSMEISSVLKRLREVID